MGVCAALLACGGASVANKANNAANVATATPQAAQPANTSGDHDDAPRISLAEAKAMFDNGSAYFIDVRDKESYDAAHIKGAVLVGPAEIAGKADTFPKGKKIIAYCS